MSSFVNKWSFSGRLNRLRLDIETIYSSAVKVQSISVLFLLVAVCMLVVAVCQTRPFGNYSKLGAILLLPAVSACVISISTSCDHRTGFAKVPQLRLLRLLVLAAMVQHGIASTSMLRYQTGATIDVYLFQRNAARALVHGINPYSLTTEDIYGPQTPLYGPGIVQNNRVQIGLPYPPVSLFVILPFYFLGDVRYAYLAAVLLTAVILLLLRTDLLTASVACFMLLTPITRDVEVRAWTEPLVLLAITCTIYAAFRKSWWLWIALGIFLASKQYSVLSLPFVPLLLGDKDWKSAWKLLKKALAVAVALTLPMVLWNVQGFWRDVVLFQIRQPFRKDALSLGNLFIPFPNLVILALVLTAIAFSLRKARLHPSMFAASYGFTLLIFVSTNKQAFCNYYFLIIQMLLLAVGTMGIPFPSRRTEARALTPTSLEAFQAEFDSSLSLYNEQTKVTS